MRISLLSQVFKAGSEVVGGVGSVLGLRFATEEPHFMVEQDLGCVQIRRYGSRIAAETTVSADEESARTTGFRRLAGYIFGGNRPQTKIAMTAPVQQAGSSAEDWVIRFFMPSGRTLDSLPDPDDESVRLVRVPEERVAVLRFTGDRSPKAIADRTDELLSRLRDSGYEPHGHPVTWLYDPPWTLPFRRRNEIAVPVLDTDTR